MNLHGWVYHIGEGTVTTYDSGLEKFLPVRTVKPQKPKLADADSGTDAKIAQA